MKVYDMSRTRLVTERFRVTAETEEDAYDALSCADEDRPDVEKIEESTMHSSTVINNEEEV